MTGFKCNVSGKVQGVGFRLTTKDKADKLGLTGYVKNLTDGSVEICAFGVDESLLKLKGWLESGGPMFSRVDSVDFEKIENNSIFSDFEIL